MKAERRYVGINLGKRTYTMAVIDMDGKTDEAAAAVRETGERRQGKP
jgi:hypothetical protein